MNTSYARTKLNIKRDEISVLVPGEHKRKNLLLLKFWSAISAVEVSGMFSQAGAGNDVQFYIKVFISLGYKHVHACYKEYVKWYDVIAKLDIALSGCCCATEEGT